MTDTQILYFLEVAKHTNFSRAAENLSVSHQVLSSQVKALERELGIELINRSNKRKIVLTAAGHVLFETWTKVMELHGRAVLQAKRLQENEQNTVIIGIQDMRFVRSYVVPMIRKLADASLGINLEYRLGSPEEMRLMLENRQADMLILISSDYDPKNNYFTKTLRAEALRLVAVVSKKHPLAKKRKLELKDLKDETILMVSENYSSVASRNFQNDLKQAGMEDVHIKHINGPREVNIAVSTGRGVALTFDELLDEDRDELKTFPIILPNAKGTDLILVWKEEQLSPIAEHMARLI